MAKTLFVTPDFTSEVTQCRTLRTPNNAEWLGVFNKALLTMLDAYNWEQINDTDLTVEETIALTTVMIDEFWASEFCPDVAGCNLPGLESPPFRLGVNGRFEMLDPATGEWGTPTGDYEIPPVPAREEATEEERLCAAAANAANVMMLVYEAITDEISLGGDALQVAAAMVAALVTAVGGWIAAPVYAIIQLTIALFVGMIELLQVLGGDVWTTEFNNQLKCAFLACATDDGDVVTFNLDCIREELNQPPNLLNPTWFYELQLFAQVLFLLETITMDGLNAAGATTGIAEPDCDDCGECGDCTPETATTTSFDLYTGEEIDGWTPPTDSIFGTGLLYVRLQVNGGSLSVSTTERCVQAIGVAGVNRFPGYPDLQLYAEVEGVEYTFDVGNNVVLDPPVVTDEVLIYIKEGDNGYMSVNAFSISWCEHEE